MESNTASVHNQYDQRVLRSLLDGVVLLLSRCVCSHRMSWCIVSRQPGLGFVGNPSKKIDIPNGRAGAITGKGGENIKYLQVQSRAKIQVTRDMDADPNSQTRVELTVSSESIAKAEEVELTVSSESIAKAEELIRDVLAEAEAGRSGVVSRRLPGQQEKSKLWGGNTFFLRHPSFQIGDSDSGTLADFDIKRESTLTLTRKSTELMQIFVNTVSGMSTSIEVKPSDTVGNLKNQISDKVDIPIDKQVLIFNKMVLHDSGTLADFHIKTESTLILMRKSRGSMQIFVQGQFGKKISLEVNPLHTIANLKARVSEKEGIPTPRASTFLRWKASRGQSYLCRLQHPKGRCHSRCIKSWGVGEGIKNLMLLLASFWLKRCNY
nr:putative ubiquitin [Tanacetum cinerariifolium]